MDKAHKEFTIVCQWGIGKKGKGLEFYNHLKESKKKNWWLSHSVFLMLFRSCCAEKGKTEDCSSIQVQKVFKTHTIWLDSGSTWPGWGNSFMVTLPHCACPTYFFLHCRPESLTYQGKLHLHGNMALFIQKSWLQTSNSQFSQGLVHYTNKQTNFFLKTYRALNALR